MDNHIFHSRLHFIEYFMSHGHLENGFLHPYTIIADNSGYSGKAPLIGNIVRHNHIHRFADLSAFFPFPSVIEDNIFKPGYLDPFSGKYYLVDAVIADFVDSHRIGGNIEIVTAIGT
jgi:hypothetical protein